MKPQHLKKSVYNPLQEDFTVDCALGDNPPQAYTVHSGEIESFEPYVANHIIKHLAELVYSARDHKTNHDDDIREIIKELEVEV